MRYIDVAGDKIDGYLAQRVALKSPPDFQKYCESRAGLMNDDPASYLNNALTYIHGDTASLLTHISAMIAALGIILIVFEDSSITQLFIFFEIISYTILAIICVYSLRNKGGLIPKEEGFDTLEHIYDRYLQRRYLYVICSDGVIVTTLVFLITMIAHLLALIF